MVLTYKNIRLLILIAVGSFLCYIIVDIIQGIIEASKVNATRTAILRSIPANYASLFDDTNVFKNKFTELSTITTPISYFDYEENKYCIFITKINANKSATLQELIQEESNNQTVNERGGCMEVSQFRFNLCYFPTPIQATKMSLYLNGDSIRIIIKNDTVVSYYVKMKSFSLKYINSTTDDLFGIEKGGNVPAYFMFLKRNKSVYFILMSVNYQDELRPDILNKLVLKGY